MNTAILNKSPLFNQIKTDELQPLLLCLKAFSKQYRKGETILKVGDKVVNIGLLLKGSAHIIKDDYWGNRTIIKEINVSEIFAEVYACLNHQESEIEIVAIEECEVMYLNIDTLTCMCQKSCSFHQQIIHNLMLIMASKNLLLTQKMEYVSKRTMREKILAYLFAQSLKQKSSRIQIPFNRQQFADYLSVNRSALSIELSKMQEEGLIRYFKNDFELLQKTKKDD